MLRKVIDSVIKESKTEQLDETYDGLARRAREGDLFAVGPGDGYR